MNFHYVPALGLIHVSEFVGTICIAYLGLDAIGKRETAVLELAAHIESVNGELLDRLQPVNADGTLQISFDCDELYMIAHVTRHFLPEAEKPRRKRVIKWARAHCPLLWYFMDRRDMIVIPTICVFSLLSFFGSSLLDLAEIKIPLEFAIPIHFLLVFSVLWILYSVYASFKIPQLASAVDQKRKILDERLKRIASESVQRSAKEVEKKTGEPIKPSRSRRPKSGSTI